MSDMASDGQYRDPKIQERTFHNSQLEVRGTHISRIDALLDEHRDIALRNNGFSEELLSSLLGSDTVQDSPHISDPPVTNGWLESIECRLRHLLSIHRTVQSNLEQLSAEIGTRQ